MEGIDVNMDPKMHRKALVGLLHGLQERRYTFVNLALFRVCSGGVKVGRMVCHEDSSSLGVWKR
jgi:hypothetical protein